MIMDDMTQEIMQSSLSGTHSNDIMIIDDIAEEKINTRCSRQVYDFNMLQESIHKPHYFRNMLLRRMLTEMKFNEHDYNCRKLCFKKGVECRVHYP